MPFGDVFQNKTKEQGAAPGRRGNFNLIDLRKDQCVKTN